MLAMYIACRVAGSTVMCCSLRSACNVHCLLVSLEQHVLLKKISPHHLVRVVWGPSVQCVQVVPHHVA